MALHYMNLNCINYQAGKKRLMGIKGLKTEEVKQKNHRGYFQGSKAIVQGTVHGSYICQTPYNLKTQ